MTDFDTMRWGDAQSVSLQTALDTAGTAAGYFEVQQTANAKWTRPCIWRVMLALETLTDADGVGVTFDVQPYIRVGVGQANVRIPLDVISVTLAQPDTLLPGIFLDVPAESLQVAFRLQNFANGENLGQSTILVAAICAPHAEPGNIAQIRDAIRDAMGIDPLKGPVDPDRGNARFFPPGGPFYDPPGFYRR